MKLLIERICEVLALGTMVGEAVRLSGGYTHRMVGFETTSGHYAAKLLNREIMARPDALANYRRAEGFEALLEARGLPVLSAMTIGGRKMQQVDGQYLYLFPWFDGRTLQDGEITPDHCRAMGRALAQIHACAECDAAPDDFDPPDWQVLTAALAAHGDYADEARLMRSSLPLLTSVTEAAVHAAAFLPRRQTLCHNDMDAKNVMWQGNDFRIIDLECLGYADPHQELMDLAVSWAGWPGDGDCFRAFVSAYARAGGVLPSRPDVTYDSRWNHLDWLAYNARRCMSQDAEERAVARTQIGETIDKIRADQARRDMFLRWFREAAEETAS